jgi:hypothetical protein
MTGEAKDHQGDRYEKDQTFGANAAAEAEEVDRLEREGGAEAVAGADPGERPEPHASGKA